MGGVTEEWRSILKVFIASLVWKDEFNQSLFECDYANKHFKDFKHFEHFPLS